jgi:organic radical activating enzyme
MLIKITERCSMGCTHCLENATTEGKDMDWSTLKDIMAFLKDNGLLNFEVLVSGGEPTEHPDFENFVSYIFECLKDANPNQPTALVILTNGLWMIDNPDKVRKIIEIKDDIHTIYFQVTNDTRYYPTKVEPHKRVFRDKNVLFFDHVESLYPIGRARSNNLEWSRKSSHCFNVRALAKQRPLEQLKDIRKDMITMMSMPHVCTPHISVNGEIKLGESRLCPVCATIYDNMDTIMDKIRNFKCDQCKIINDSLPPIYRKLVE